MTEEQINELERLAAQATPGPWEWRHHYITTVDYMKPCVFGATDGGIPIATLNCGAFNGEANAAYIMVACNTAPGLIAENRALQERVRKLERKSQVLAQAIANDMICAWCWLGKKCPQWDEENVGRATDIVACQKMFLKWAEQAAKEAGE